MQLSINPIIIKELRSRMRGARAFVILTVMLLLLAGFTYGLYRLSMIAAGYSTVLSPAVGRSLFTGLALAELLIICFITPALTAGAISGEREKLTYEMLLTTPLSPASILWGKLISALSYVLLLIFAAIPIASLVFIFGGVSPREMLNALLVLVVVAIMLGVVGIFMSAWLGRTGRATIGSYLVVLFLIVTPIAAFIAVGVVNQAEPPRELLIPNPISALFSVISPTNMSGGPMDIFAGLGAALGGNLGRLTGMSTGVPRPLYHYALPLYTLLSILLYVAAAQLVKPTQRRRMNRREIGGALLALLALAAVVSTFFFTTTAQYESFSPLQPQFDDVSAAPRPVAVEVAVAQPVAISTATPVRPDEEADQPIDTPDPAALSDSDRGTIYATAIQKLHAEALAPTILNGAPIFQILSTTDDEIAFSSAPISETVEISASVQNEITNLLRQQGAQDVVWLAQSGVAEEIPAGTFQLTLSNLHIWPDDAILVSVKATSSERTRGRSYATHLAHDGWRWDDEPVATWEK